MRGLGPKQLAEKLRSRCLRELPSSKGMPDLYYLIDPVKLSEMAPSGSYFFEVHERRKRESFVSHFTWGPPSEPKWQTKWIARVEITPQLEVIVRDDLGKVERAVLDCALRGPDRR